MRKLALLIFLAALIIPAQAMADYIVNTGPGPSTNNYSNYFASDNSYAAEFTLTAKTTINSIEGWFFTESYQSAGSAAAALYANKKNSGNQDIPDLNSLLFTKATFSIPGNTNAANWYGASGLTWTLNPGTYWVAFEGLNSTQRKMEGPSQNPIGPEAKYVAGQASSVYRSDASNIGVRMNAAAVPIPGAIWLLGTGLLGLAGWRKNSKA